MRRSHAREWMSVKRNDVLYPAAMLIVLAIFAVSVSLSPELLDRLMKSLKGAIRLYVGF